MPRKCKDCPICGKRALKRLANHLADVHELSPQERQPYLIRAKPTALGTKSAKNVDNTEMNDGSKDWLKLETKTEHNS